MAANSLFTLADLANLVCLNVGSTDDLTQAKAKKNINRALIRFSEMGYWSWQYLFAQTLNTVASQEVYEVSNVVKINSIYTAQPIQRRLTLVEDRKFRSMYPNNTAVGAPYYWRRMGSSSTTVDTQKVGLYPIPDTVYNLKYDCVAPITLLTSDTDDIRLITKMPSHHVDLVIEMATAIQWKEIDDAQAAEQMQECLLRLKAAYADDVSEIDDKLIMAPLEADNIDRYFDPTLDPRFDGP